MHALPYRQASTGPGAAEPFPVRHSFSCGAGRVWQNEFHFYRRFACTEVALRYATDSRNSSLLRFSVQSQLVFPIKPHKTDRLLDRLDRAVLCLAFTLGAVGSSLTHASLRWASATVSDGRAYDTIGQPHRAAEVESPDRHAPLPPSATPHSTRR